MLISSDSFFPIKKLKTSSMEEMRKQLDALMGLNRNGDKPKLLLKSFTDERICKFDLCGLCPYTLFPNTKQDLGKCPFELCPAPDNFKEEYKKARQTQDFGFEKELLIFLEKKARSCDEQIAKKRRQLEQRGSIVNQNEPDELIKIRNELEELTSKVEELGNEGMVDEAQALLEKIETLKKEKESYEVKLPKEQQLIICDTCGATLSANETDQRLSDHFAGKSHLGYQKIRDKIKSLLNQYPTLKEEKRKKEREWSDQRESKKK